MNYQKSWTQPGEGFSGVDQDLPIISEEEVLRYLQKNLDEQDQIDEIIGKIKSAIAKHKDKKDFKKNAAKLALHHSDQSNSHGAAKAHHDDYSQAHTKTSSAMFQHGHNKWKHTRGPTVGSPNTKPGQKTGGGHRPEKKGPAAAASREASDYHHSASQSHAAARYAHDRAATSHDLARKAAVKGDHEAYKKHSEAAKKHTENAKGESKSASHKTGNATFNSQHADSGDRDVHNHISKKHGGNK